MSAVESLLDLSLSPVIVVSLVFTIALLESLALVGVIVPGVMLITAAASVAGHQEIALPWLLGAAIIGAILGDGISFQLGYRHRDKVTSRWPLAQHPEWLDRGKRFFKRYGIYSVFIGRFIGPIRPIIPLVAGMMRMPPRIFTWANVASALLWAPAYVLPGYLLGHSWQQYLSLPANVELALSILGLCVIVAALFFSWGRAQVGRHGRVYLAVARIVRRVPFLRRPWLAMGHSGEVPLASLLLFIFSLTLFSGWTLLVIKHGEPLSMDLQAQQLFNWLSANSDALLSLSLVLAQVGDKLGIATLMLPWGLWMLLHRRVDMLGHWVAALGGIAVLNIAGKEVFGRPRPNTPDYLMGSNSYPSAHTSSAVVIIGLAAAFIAAAIPRRQRGWLYWIAIVLATMMALSRLMIGVHWLSDLMGGALLGLLVCAAIRLNWQCKPRPALPHCPWLILGTITIVMMSARVIWLPPV